jgi:hypothetical protein
MLLPLLVLVLVLLTLIRSRGLPNDASFISAVQITQ